MKVYFVGAGPGSPDLLTRKAEALLRSARKCIYAGSLVSPAVLDLIPHDAERYDSAGMTLPQIVEVILDARRRNEDVVRLHSGDPAIYGAIAEQIAELNRRGIDYEVVPGVSSFQAAAAALGWELTLPEISQSIVLTRTEGRTTLPPGQTLESFAQTGATLCLFLSVHRLREHAERLIPYYGRDCPTAVVYHASWPDQKIVRGTLADIAERTAAEGIERTAMIIVRPGETNTRSRLYDPEFEHGCRTREDDA
ncbi:precorrin-4 C(11)-methyltransferase [Thermostilla marina]